MQSSDTRLFTTLCNRRNVSIRINAYIVCGLHIDSILVLGKKIFLKKMFQNQAMLVKSIFLQNGILLVAHLLLLLLTAEIRVGMLMVVPVGVLVPMVKISVPVDMVIRRLSLLLVRVTGTALSMSSAEETAADIG